MRSLAVALLVMVGSSALAQDAAMQASQAAMQASQQASEAAMQAAQQANQAAMQAAQQASQQAIQDAQSAASADNLQSCLAPKPIFSVKPGTYGAPQKVYIEEHARHAALYYTTDGWTPTDQSTRYTGPVTVDATTRLQAVAFVPGCHRSSVAEAVYTLPGPALKPSRVEAPNGVLRKGTELELAFVAPVSSETARVGDPLELMLAAPLRAGDRVFAPSEVKALATVTAVERPAGFGQPGELTFAMQSLTVGGVTVPLSGVETTEGLDHYDKVRHRILIPLVGLSVLGIRGDQAVIAAGTSVTAKVAADMPLPAQAAETGSPTTH